MRFVLFSVMILFGVRAAADTQSCRVVAIADGDSLTCAFGSTRSEVRLDEIDAPEHDQPHGGQSKQSLAKLCLNQQVALERRGVDDYGRVLARVTCGGVDANESQVRLGMAWVYDHYVKDRSLYNDQTLARSEGLGLWADVHPMPPWDWRYSRKRGVSVPPNGSTPDSPSCKIKGNISGRGEHIYHVPGQKYYAATQIKSSSGELWFCSEGEARAAGWRAAKI